MTIIFLDIDGVLNTGKHLRTQIQKNNGQKTYEMQFEFDPVAMENIHEIVLKTNAKIVITSTWRDVSRDTMMWDAMMANFTTYELAEYVIGKTPILSTESTRVERWKEIRNWIEENEDLKIEKYIIIDDEWSMGELDDNFVKCWEHSGLNNDIKAKVLEMILN